MSLTAALFAAALIAPEAQTALDRGSWGLLMENLSEEGVAAARECTGPSILFMFGAENVQLLGTEGEAPESYLAAKWTDEAPHQKIELFAAPDDAAPARVYLYDPAANSLMRLMEDGDGDALYFLCD